MVYKENKTAYDFTTFKTKGHFGDPVRNGIIMMNMANNEDLPLIKDQEVSK